MSNVNADATQLLTILKNMRTSISSIETTRSSVKMKYQQLGIGWNDKKYDELGTIVKDCNKALNDILQIMLQAEKYVASLAKSVQEYDNVNLDTPSARNSFLQGLQTPNVGNSSYQYCLGVLTQGSTPDGYIAVISQRHENAEQNVRESRVSSVKCLGGDVFPSLISVPLTVISSPTETEGSVCTFSSDFVESFF